MMTKRRFGSFLVDEGLVTQEQLQRALQHQVKLRNVLLGQLLVEMAALRARDLERIVVAQLEDFEQGPGRMPLGERLVYEGLISREDLRAALHQQQRLRDKRIGELMVDLGLLSAHDLNDVVGRQLEEMAVG